MSYSLPPVSRASRATTLTELLVVMLLIVVLSAIGISVFFVSNRHAAIEGAAREVKKTLDLARTMAVADTTVYSVVLMMKDTDHPAAIWIDETSPTLKTSMVLPPTTRNKVVHPHIFDNSVEVEFDAAGGGLTSGTTTIYYRFFPDGSSDDGSIETWRMDAHPDEIKSRATIHLQGPTASSNITIQRTP